MQSGEPKVKRFSVALPASIVSDTPHLREKTAKLGAIARATSIFGVNEVILYPDDPKRDQNEDMRLCSEILQFLDTPQYLRKKIFKLNPTLRFTGILPPLQAPHHNVPHTLSEIKVGDVRDGVVVSRTGQNLFVDAGLEKEIRTVGSHRVGERVTLRLVEVGRNLSGQIVDATALSSLKPEMEPMYRGYRVFRETSLGKILKEPWTLKVGTSRYGSAIQEILPSLSKAMKDARSVLVAFGAPNVGLREILAAEKLVPSEAFHYFLNTVPDQQTATVRTEEALLVSLGIMNLARRLDLGETVGLETHHN